MLLVVAEKYNLAADLAAALIIPATLKREEFCFYGMVADNHAKRAITIAFGDGHLLELKPPESYDPKWDKWQLETLPVCPPDMKFLYQARNNEAQTLLNGIRHFAEGAEEIVNACDAGREGELIFWEIARILSLARGRIITRMWIQNPTAAGLRAAFLGRREGSSGDLHRLREAALLRQQADWLYGVNMSRYVTLCMPKHPDYGGTTHAIGRVKTPVLGLVFDASERARSFKEEVFYRLRLSFKGTDETFQALVIAPEALRFGAVDTMFKDPEGMDKLSFDIALYAGRWQSFDEVKEGFEYPPEPFNLVELQRTCFRIFRWSSSYTEKLAQRCYSVEKTLTYPRTESYHIPQSMQHEMGKVQEALWEQHLVLEFPSLKSMELPPIGTRYFKEDKEMEEHHAIVPTGRIPDRFERDGKMSHAFLLWELVVRRTTLALMPPAKVNRCRRILTYEHPSKPEIQFRAVFKADPLVEENWMAYEEVIGNSRGYGKKLAERRTEKFPKSGETADCTKIQKVRGYTERPPELDEDTLIGTMQRLRLGTAATRSEAIEDLVRRGYMERRKSGFISPLGLGSHLVQELRTMNAEEVLSPDLTARWEQVFDEIQSGEKPIEDRTKFLKEAVENAGKLGLRLLDKGATKDATVYCPSTHIAVTEDAVQYFFAGYKDIIFKKIYAGRRMAASDWREILVAGPKVGAGPFKGFTGKSGSYSARVGFVARAGKYGNFKLIREWDKK